jgi:hypothetical protein
VPRTHFSARGGDLAHLVSSVCLVGVVRPNERDKTAPRTKQTTSESPYRPMMDHSGVKG